MTDLSPVTTPAHDDRLERYLLGQLDEAARDEVEAQAFSDPAVADALDEVETALVDAYVTGALAEERRTAFRLALDSRPRLQLRVQVAHALGRRKSLAPVARWWLPMLAAAAALVVAVSVWMLQRAAPPESSPPQTAAVAAAPSADTAAAEAPAPPQPLAPGPTPPLARSVFAVTLPLGVSRAADVLEVRVPSGSTHLQLRVPIAPGDDFARYRVRFRGPGNRELGVADPAPLAPDRTVWLTVARETLADGLHDVAVEGLDAQGVAEPLTLQQVRVAIDTPRQ